MRRIVLALGVAFAILASCGGDDRDIQTREDEAVADQADAAEQDAADAATAPSSTVPDGEEPPCDPSPARPSLSQIAKGIPIDLVPNEEDRSALALEIAAVVDTGEVCLRDLEAWLAGGASDGPIQAIVDAFVASRSN